MITRTTNQTFTGKVAALLSMIVLSVILLCCTTAVAQTPTLLKVCESTNAESSSYTEILAIGQGRTMWRAVESQDSSSLHITDICSDQEISMKKTTLHYRAVAAINDSFGVYFADHGVFGGSDSLYFFSFNLSTNMWCDTIIRLEGCVSRIFYAGYLMEGCFVFAIVTLDTTGSRGSNGGDKSYIIKAYKNKRIEKIELNSVPWIYKVSIRDNTIEILFVNNIPPYALMIAKIDGSQYSESSVFISQHGILDVFVINGRYYIIQFDRIDSVFSIRIFNPQTLVTEYKFLCNGKGYWYDSNWWYPFNWYRGFQTKSGSIYCSIGDSIWKLESNGTIRKFGATREFGYYESKTPIAISDFIVVQEYNQSPNSTFLYSTFLSLLDSNLNLIGKIKVGQGFTWEIKEYRDTLWLDSEGLLKGYTLATLTSKESLIPPVNHPFTLYPNPTSDFITIKSDEPVEEITVMDMMGKVLFTASTPTIDVSALPACPYFIKVRIGEEVIIKRFIKR